MSGHIKEIKLDTSLLVTSDHQLNWCNCAIYFKEILKETTESQNISEDNINHILSIVIKAYSLLINNRKSFEKNVLSTLEDCLRICRNLSLKSETQTYFGNNNTLMEIIKHLFIYLPQESADEQIFLPCRRICIQFIGNLVVNHSSNPKIIWTKWDVILKNNLNHNDEKIREYSAMVLYNIILNHNTKLERDLEFNLNLLTFVTRNGEYGRFILQNFISKDNYITELYPQLDAQYRSILLEFLYEISLKSDIKISLNSLKFLMNELGLKIHTILNTSEMEKIEDITPYVITKLLQALTVASSLSNYLQFMQDDKNFLINCACTLKAMHLAGKSNNNALTPIEKLFQIAPNGKRPLELEQHPAYGFKAHLVQLIGNLCANCRSNQDYIRDVGLLPILLECTNIDARNPFLPQRVLVALRYILEGNDDNKEYIASMQKKHFTQSPLLKEMGIRIQDNL